MCLYERREASGGCERYRQRNSLKNKCDFNVEKNSLISKLYSKFSQKEKANPQNQPQDQKIVMPAFQPNQALWPAMVLLPEGVICCL